MNFIELWSPNIYQHICCFGSFYHLPFKRNFSLIKLWYHFNSSEISVDCLLLFSVCNITVIKLIPFKSFTIVWYIYIAIIMPKEWISTFVYDYSVNFIDIIFVVFLFRILIQMYNFIKVNKFSNLIWKKYQNVMLEILI